MTISTTKWLLILLLSVMITTTSALAQTGGAWNRQVISPPVPNGTGQPVPNAVYRVCLATATGTPCPTAGVAIYSDPALTQSLPNPGAADVNGMYTFFAIPGAYLIQENPIPGTVYSYLIYINTVGTVTSVGLSVSGSPLFTVSGSPVTTTGTLTLTPISQSADLVFGNCTSGTTTPSFCSLTAAMIPSTLNSTTINGTLTTASSGNTSIGGTLGVTGAITAPSLTTTGNISIGGSISTSGNITAATGTVTADNLTVTNPVNLHFSQLTSSSTPAASTGIIALGYNDHVEWRNSTNTGDEGLSTISDRLNIGFPFGIVLSGASPGILLGGTTSSFPGLFNSAAVLQVRLADDSADANLTAAAATFSAPITSTATDHILDGTEVTTPGIDPPAGTDKGYYKAGHGWCVLSHAGVEYCTVSGGGAAGYAPQRVTLSSPLSPLANTQTSVLNETVTFPSPVGTYRALVSYGIWASVSANACSAQVSDGTNAYALSGQDSNGSGYIGLSGSEISTITYNASAPVSFTLYINCNGYGGGGVSVNSGLFSWTPAEPTFLSVTPIFSN